MVWSRPARPELLRFLWALLVAWFATGAAQALEVPSKPLGRVSDFADLLSPGDRSRIEAQLAAIEERTSNQLTVAIFRSLQGDSLEDFSIRLADAWKVGQKGRDNGLILTIFVADRKIRIEVGYGLEGVITDALAGRIIRDVLAPRFRSQDYAAGITEAIRALDAASRGEFKARAEPRRRSVSAPVLGFLPFVLFFILAWILLSFRRAAHLGGRGRRTHRRGTWWVGPWGGGGGGRSGGLGGGFSGGGGGFGGGGASGGW